MTLDDLIAEGNRLSRKCFWALPGKSDSVAASWGGSKGNQNIWLSVDATYLPLPKRGLLQLLQSDQREFTCAIIESHSLPSTAERLQLQEKCSMPPIEAIFMLGNSRVSEWLRKLDWPANEPFNDNFPDKAAAEYSEYWMEQCPLYSGSPVFAQIGGWHFPWPDGDFANLLTSGETLQVWTFQDSEPWIEIWESASNLRVIERIT